MSVLSKNRKMILPGNRKQNRNPSNCSGILKQHCIPLSIRRIHDSSLCHALSTISTIITKYISTREFSFQRITVKACFRPHPAVSQGMNQKNIIIAVYFLNMRTLIA